MTTRRTLIATLVATAIAGAATAALAQGPGYGPGHGPGAMGQRMGANPEFVSTRLADLKAVLKLQPNQEAAFKNFETRVKAAAEGRAKLFESRPAPEADTQARADFHVAMMKFNAQAADEVNQARKALYATLSPEQKAAFDRNTPRGMALAGGFGGGGHGMGGGGYGPGHGAGMRGHDCPAATPTGAGT